SLTELSALVAGAAPGASSARAAADVALHDAWARDAELALVELLGGDADRSEERRVGKECRAWWWPYHEKKKNEVLHIFKGKHAEVVESINDKCVSLGLLHRRSLR